MKNKLVEKQNLLCSQNWSWQDEYDIQSDIIDLKSGIDALEKAN